MRYFTHHIVIFICLVSSFFVKPAQAQGLYSEYEIKGVFIGSLAKYMTLSAKAFNNPRKIRMGILGEDPFGTKIDQICRGRKIDGRVWEIYRAKDIKNLLSCQIIFVCNSEKDKIEDICMALKNTHILSIADQIDNFCQLGGIVNFTNSKAVFEINMEAAKRAEITVDGKFIKSLKSLKSSGSANPNTQE